MLLILQTIFIADGSKCINYKHLLQYGKSVSYSQMCTLLENIRRYYVKLRFFGNFAFHKGSQMPWILF